MHDQRSDGRGIRLCKVIDDFNREGPEIAVDYLLQSAWMIRSLARILAWRRRPNTLRYDNGLEYVSAALMAWASCQDIQVNCLQPGQPQHNACIERYSRTVRYDRKVHYRFDSIEEVQAYATRWLWT